MTTQQKADKINDLLKKRYPTVTPPLNHTNAWELLVATILSAQCTDARVNMVTPSLFAKYPSVEAMAAADIEDVKTLIRSTGFYNNKAKNILAAAKKIVSGFGGKVPDTMEELITLPGVARKTANVVLSQWFHKQEGIVVDTHVIRLSRWLGLSGEKSPEKIEQDLMKLVPREEWGDFGLRLVFLGREVLTAKNPKHEGTEWEPLVEIK